MKTKFQALKKIPVTNMHGKWILDLAYNQRRLFNEIAEENL